MRQLERLIGLGLMIFATVGMMVLLATMANLVNPEMQVGQASTASTPSPAMTETAAAPVVSPTETFPPSTPLATLTPSRTLLPPPTFEPPTLSPVPSVTPTITPTTTLPVNVNSLGINGLETATPEGTVGCEIRDDWKLTYTVQSFDTLEKIANIYGTYSSDLAQGNCLADANVITIGQVLHVPGDVQPATPAIECVPWEVLTPLDHGTKIDGTGQLTFNWRGPHAPRNLIRVIKPDGTTWERTVDLRQNETIDLKKELPDGGVYQWYVYPLDMSFRQVDCKEGGPWTFEKTNKKGK